MRENVRAAVDDEQQPLFRDGNSHDFIYLSIVLHPPLILRGEVILCYQA